MPAGFQAFNEGNVVQIDENFVNQRLTWRTTLPASGSGNWIRLQGADIRNECPLVLARSAGWMGGFQLLTSMGGGVTVPSGSLFLMSDSPVEIAVFSSKGKISPGNFGLEVYNAASELVYASAHAHPRIFNIARLNGNLPAQTVAFTGSNGQRPWVCLNDISPGLPFAAGGGTDYGYPPFVHTVRVGVSTVEYRYIDNGFIPNALAGDTTTSQFRGRTLALPLAFIPGT